MTTTPRGRLSRRALDPAFESPPRRSPTGTVPFVILGIADRRGVVRLESFGPNDGAADRRRRGVPARVDHQADRRDGRDARGRGRPPGPRGAARRLAARARRRGRAAVLRVARPDAHQRYRRRRRRGAPARRRRPRRADRDGRSPCRRPPRPDRPSATPRPRSTSSRRPSPARLGRPFDDLVRANVLDPLGMADTAFDPGAGRARPHGAGRGRSARASRGSTPRPP